MNDKTYEMLAILQQYFSDFVQKRSLPFVVQDSVPVAWFGDCEKYFTSERKVVTVGLNPSFHEFTNPNSSLRLPIDTPIERLYQALNKYFICEPYRKYFLWFEKVLNVIDTSYGGKFQKSASNTAVHIDIFSSIATDPMWGGLTQNQKILVNQYALFRKLLDCLAPDIIFVSVSKQVMQQVFHLSDQMAFDTGSDKIEIYRRNNITYIYGRNFKGTPFYAQQECISILTDYFHGNSAYFPQPKETGGTPVFLEKNEVYKEPEFEYILVKTSENTIKQRGNLYEATRYAWKLNFERARKYKYVFSVINGIVQEIYDVSEWRVIKQGDYCGRLEFFGEPADRKIADQFIGKHIPAKYCKPGNANPVCYKQS